MACHIPIYRAFLHVLRAISQHPALTSMLLPSSTSDPLSPYSISALLEKMKKCVDTYANRLKLYNNFIGFNNNLRIINGL